MTEKEPEKIVKEMFTDDLKSSGFEQAKNLEFIRPTSFGHQRIGFSLNRDASGVFWLSAGIGIIFRDINELFFEENRVDLPTIGVPIHYLYPEEPHKRRLTAPNTKRAFLDMIHDKGFAFFERYSSIVSLDSDLKSPNFDCQFPLTPNDRIGLLSVIDCLNGDRESAISRLTNASEKSPKNPPKYRHYFTSLLRRIVP